MRERERERDSEVERKKVLMPVEGSKALHYNVHTSKEKMRGGKIDGVSRYYVSMVMEGKL